MSMSVNVLSTKNVVNHPKTSGSKAGTNSIIQEIALDSLKESAIGLFMTGISCLFVAKQNIPDMIKDAIFHLYLNTLFRVCAGFTMKAKTFDKVKAKLDKKDPFSWLLHYFNPLNFACLDNQTRGTLVHEMGHALTANFVFQNVKSSIEIFPKGGLTTISYNGLTEIGSYLGKTNSDLFTTAAGPLAGSLLAITDLGAAHYVKDSHPQLHRYLNCTAIMNVSEHALYAGSALFKENPNNDFAKLWKNGHIHPLASVICIIALPLIFHTIMSNRSLKNKQSSSILPRHIKKQIEHAEFSKLSYF